MAGGKVSAKKLKLAERRKIALAWRIEGHSLRTIADKFETDLDVKVSHMQVKRDLEAMQKEAVEQQQALAEELLTLTVMRLEGIVQAHWPQAVGGERHIIDAVTGEETTIFVQPDVASAKLLIDVADKYAKIFGWGKTNDSPPAGGGALGETLIYLRNVPDEQLEAMISNLLPLRGDALDGGNTVE